MSLEIVNLSLPPTMLIKLVHNTKSQVKKPRLNENLRHKTKYGKLKSRDKYIHIIKCEIR